ncbi:IclR family transcriptional regulator [Flavisphingomonas formosensis]|uniref:IclR family transcriptional regulator n=1 Tax=Flavisphingomonas formosensis TaxID=861534 RepID=UPI0012FC17A0|nr:IclR family transcriptional regulator [Sphingomonas formosensis]
MSDPRGPLAVDRAFAVLALLAEHPRGLSLTTLSQVLDVPKSSLLGLLRGLRTSGHIVLRQRLYAVGPASLSLARSLLGASPDLAGEASPILERLALDAGETSILATMAPDERAIVYVAKFESLSAIRFAATVGDRRPLHASAGGLLLLAYQPPAWIESFLRSARLDRITDRTVTDPARLRAILAKIRTEGCAITAGDTTEGVSGLAVPVFDASGSVAAAMMIGGPIDRVARDRPRLIALLRNAAAEVSQRLGAP